MPKILEWKGYKFFFFSNEGDPLEPCHVHVRKGESLSKYWVIPDVYLEYSWGISTEELKMLEKVVEKHKDLIVEKWNEHFNR